VESNTFSEKDSLSVKSAKRASVAGVLPPLVMETPVMRAVRQWKGFDEI